MNKDTSNEIQVSAAYQKRQQHFAEYIPGLVLILWIVIPVSLALIFEDTLFTLLCLYPLLSPLIWMAVGVSKPDTVKTTIGMGIIGHLLLVVSLWYILKNFSNMGNNIGFDFIGLLGILAVLVYSAAGSIITIIVFSKFHSAEN